MKPEGTRDRILTAAEEAFAIHGFNGVSLRDVVKRADVNLAAVNYHFGFLAVFSG
jgi:AcrR family transcriptional regulator